jgi:hypothetical protein
VVRCGALVSCWAYALVDYTRSQSVSLRRCTAAAWLGTACCVVCESAAGRSITALLDCTALHCRLSHLGAKETVDIHKEIGPVIYDIMGKRIFGAEWLQG